MIALVELLTPGMEQTTIIYFNDLIEKNSQWKYNNETREPNYQHWNQLKNCIPIIEYIY